MHNSNGLNGDMPPSYDSICESNLSNQSTELSNVQLTRTETRPVNTQYANTCNINFVQKATEGLLPE